MRNYFMYEIIISSVAYNEDSNKINIVNYEIFVYLCETLDIYFSSLIHLPFFNYVLCYRYFYNQFNFRPSFNALQIFQDSTI